MTRGSNDQILTEKFNIVDLLALAVVVLLIVAGVYKVVYVNKGVQRQNARIAYTVHIENVRKWVPRQLRTGDAIRETNSNAPLGRITAVEVSPYSLPLDSGKGFWVDSRVPGRFSVRVKVESPATVTSVNTSIGSKKIKVGSTVAFETPTVSTKGVVVEVKRMK